MSVYSHGARLSQTDLNDLDNASNRLAAAATAIRRANPNWGEAVVQLIYEANQVIVRIQNKGAAAFTRYLEKHGLQKPQDASNPEAAGEQAPLPPSAAPEPEES